MKPLILHVSTGLNRGGAESVLEQVVSSPEVSGYRHHVISLIGLGAVGAELAPRGVEVEALELDAGPLRGLRRLLTLGLHLRGERPHRIQGWMYHGNLAAAVLGLLSGAPVIWGIHHTVSAAGSMRFRTRLVRMAGALLSRIPRAIVYCAPASMRAHRRWYSVRRAVVIGNGVDTERYTPAGEHRTSMRAAWGIADGEFVVGTVGRDHPDKDYGTFARACALARAAWPGRMRFVLCGRGLDRGNATLSRALAEAGVEGDTLMLGERGDVPEILRALDLFAMTSAAEALPLALLEAMSSGLPCVATNVGECGSLLGSAWVAEPGDAAGLARLWVKAASLDAAGREAAGAELRARVRHRWSREAMAQAYSDLYGAAEEAGAGLEPLVCRLERR